MGIRGTELTTLMKHLQYLEADRDVAGGQVTRGEGQEEEKGKVCTCINRQFQCSL